ncbi:A/G-specific adenine glycosylase [Vagococcus penaei]|uniref:Adenine DNA glycosylase n=1 Tax=Vagococcus penaei TaxID=633807 RepID=A0A1Q2D3W0_9ENTE|nr:A/G-specific adenine glycosylase [Vagococcus penaei]AQP53080.1 A/G-specific adenine glycosylase [Vagococcus penaei]RSU06057.1 A/G-specific adenine glycosylase [Vagococcus penaei]
MSKENKDKVTWSDAKIAAFQDHLLTWYHAEKRVLPWRENTDPYRVWVSEIMLQQTQVVTVIPYFERFMDWFPTITDLANAEEDRLLKAWEGLGYYSRVRNMQKAAQMIVAEHGGQMPTDITSILALKGIGPYTGGAIASIAFNQPEPAIDGNVMRVYSRLFCIEDDIAQVKSRRVFDDVVRQTISQNEPGDFNQALMDLGSDICNPTKPKCETCPIKAFCEARQRGIETTLPVKTKKAKAVPSYHVGLALKNSEGAYLFVQRPADGLLANFWTFPMLEVPKETYQVIEKSRQSYEKEQAVVSFPSQENLFDALAAEEMSDLETLTPLNQLLITHYPQAIWQTQPVGAITHLFSHRKWHILVAYGVLSKERVLQEFPNGIWVTPEDFKNYAFPKPQDKMWEIIVKKGYY